jgi:hypothetical protein
MSTSHGQRHIALPAGRISGHIVILAHYHARYKPLKRERVAEWCASLDTCLFALAPVL